MGSGPVQQLAGQRILVTGAAGGIGAPMCRLLLARGAEVCGLDRSADGLAELESATEETGLATLCADLTEAEGLAKAIGDHQQRHGRFSGLVNNAAFIRDIGSLQGMNPEAWREEIDANLNGCYNVTHAVLPSLCEGGGAVVTISSVNALTSIGHPAYSAAKAGMVSFARSVAMEYGSRGVRSNAVLPGTVATPAWRSRAEADPQIFAKLASWYPLGRIVEPEDVAKAVAFLLSDDAAAISGAVLNVDCGLMAGIKPFAAQLTLEDMG